MGLAYSNIGAENRSMHCFDRAELITRNVPSQEVSEQVLFLRTQRIVAAYDLKNDHHVIELSKEVAASLDDIDYDACNLAVLYRCWGLSLGRSGKLMAALETIRVQLDPLAELAVESNLSHTVPHIVNLYWAYIYLERKAGFFIEAIQSTKKLVTLLDKFLQHYHKLTGYLLEIDKWAEKALNLPSGELFPENWPLDIEKLALKKWYLHETKDVVISKKLENTLAAGSTGGIAHGTQKDL